MDTGKGFFSALFDFSFSDFIFTKIIPVLYGLGILVAGVYAIVFIVGGFTKSIGLGILFLILSPLAFLLFVVLARVYLEVIIVIFRIAEHVRDLVRLQTPGGHDPDLSGTQGPMSPSF